jgi:hypothetical protein
MKRSLTIVLAAFIAVVGAHAAHANDLCLSAAPAPDRFIIKKAKKLKANSAVALNGIWFAGMSSAPFNGSAIMKADGTTVRAGIFVHSLAVDPVNFTVEWTTDATFAGTANYDANGDFMADATLTLAAVDCSTLTAP